MTEKTCQNKGCGKKYTESENTESSCSHHPGGPIFHEGLKGWACCSKRVISFDDFLQIPGCTVGAHSDKVPEEPKVEATTKALVEVKSGTESFQVAPSIFSNVRMSNEALQEQTKKPEPEVEDEDPVDFKAEVGMKCKRKGCGFEFTGNDDVECVYHPGAPVFHEGSKGWSCCSRKVLEFEEFLKIKGCKTGRHLYVGTREENQEQKQKEKKPEVRHDWYQSPTGVTISFYSKKVDRNACDITFEEQKLTVKFTTADGLPFVFESDLFQPIVPNECSYMVLGTKVEVSLKKANGISWPSIEPTNNVTSWTTFGISGRTGTVGAKEMFISEDSPLYALK
ncbi:hypothetical protein MP638_001269 [Amoeboaphelidium occidentale]|nr:hypothetical protein MP638_001269 [Amoeboaphelidium occidentale]